MPVHLKVIRYVLLAPIFMAFVHVPSRPPAISSCVLAEQRATKAACSTTACSALVAKLREAKATLFITHAHCKRAMAVSDTGTVPAPLPSLRCSSLCLLPLSPSPTESAAWFAQIAHLVSAPCFTWPKKKFAAAFRRRYHRRFFLLFWPLPWLNGIPATNSSGESEGWHAGTRPQRTEFAAVHRI